MSLPEGSGQGVGPRKGGCAELCFLPARVRRAEDVRRATAEPVVPLKACTWESCTGKTRGIYGAPDPRSLQIRLLWSQEEPAGNWILSPRRHLERGVHLLRERRVKGGASRPLTARGVPRQHQRIPGTALASPQQSRPPSTLPGCKGGKRLAFPHPPKRLQQPEDLPGGLRGGQTHLCLGPRVWEPGLPSPDAHTP